MRRKIWRKDRGSGMERIVCEWICAYNGARESKSGELIVARAADEAAAICGA